MATVVLAWNGRDDTLACLDSLRAARLAAATDDRVRRQRLDRRHARAAVEAAPIPRDRDRRPAATSASREGNNVGLRAALGAGADYVLLLNNDTVVAPRLVPELVAEAERRPDAGAICPLIYYARAARPDLVRRRPLRRPPRPQRPPHGLRRARPRPVRPRRARSAAPPAPRCSCAARCSSRSACSTATCSSRSRTSSGRCACAAAGWRIFFVPRGKVWHRVSVATGGEHAPATAYYEMRNTLAVCDRYAPLRGSARRCGAGRRSWPSACCTRAAGGARSRTCAR